MGLRPSEEPALTKVDQLEVEFEGVDLMVVEVPAAGGLYRPLQLTTPDWHRGAGS